MFSAHRSGRIVSVRRDRFRPSLSYPAKSLAFVYHNHALHITPTIARLVLGCVAAWLWVLFLHEVLFRSGKVKTHWVKRRLFDLLVVLSIALLTFVFVILTGGHSHRGR